MLLLGGTDLAVCQAGHRGAPSCGLCLVCDVTVGEGRGHGRRLEGGLARLSFGPWPLKRRHGVRGERRSGTLAGVWVR